MRFVDTKFVPKYSTIAAKVESSETMYKIWFFLQGCNFFWDVYRHHQGCCRLSHSKKIS
jgi:hypothetical protein